MGVKSVAMKISQPYFRFSGVCSVSSSVIIGGELSFPGIYEPVATEEIPKPPCVRRYGRVCSSFPSRSMISLLLPRSYSNLMVVRDAKRDEPPDNLSTAFGILIIPMPKQK
mmetsp:Transcript_13490/g.20051  ORF Transcript_13490/g.20051 Transcript_13490/m.20051 type:complete len:111 (+) Transcript_13490:77-409(+)